MKHIITFLLLTAICALHIEAKSLVLVLTDGTLVYYLLGEGKDPVMTYSKETITVNTDQFTFDGVERFYISTTDDPSGVDDVKLAETKFDGQTLVVGTTKQAVRIYRIDGTEVKVKPVVGESRTVVSVADLERGNYVVKVGEQSFKIQKK